MDKKKMLDEFRQVYLDSTKLKGVHIFDKTKKPIINPHELLFLQGLSQLNNGKYVKMSEISNYFNVTPSATSQFIRKLEKNGLIDRMTKDDDRRCVFVRPSAKAKKELEKQEERMEEHFLDLADALGEADTVTFLRIMRKLKDYYVNGRKDKEGDNQ